MVTETAQVQPTGRIIWDNRNLHMQTKKIETVANCYPGRLVMKGTNDDDVLVTDAASKGYGWLGYEHTTKKYRPATLTTIYVASDQVAVVYGAGLGVLAWMNTVCVITKGQILTSAANGCVTPGSAGTDDIVAQAAESKTTTSAGAAIMVVSRI
jgi:hypothetical protein